MNIVICGHGALAKSIVSLCIKEKIKVGLFGEMVTLPSDSVAIHCGTGRQLEGLLVDCGSCGIPVIQASSDQKLPHPLCVPVIDAPHLALPILAVLKGLPVFVAGLKNLGLTKCLIVSHQKPKETAPETAWRIADVIGVPKEEIHFIRDEFIQEGLGVPHKHLEQHGYHWIKFAGDDVEIDLTLKVNGLGPCAAGAIHIARNVAAAPALANKVYPASEFI